MKTVYLIDDDPVFVLLVEKMIGNEDPSLDIQTFSDGEQAIDRLKACATGGGALPDLVFLDLNMPVMDGWEFLDEYRSFYPTLGKTIALYILSSTISPDDLKRSQKYPVVSDILIKPLTKDLLAQILARL
ncbi:MAG TPA: response regulator [Puia sp.]|nr:response regulator [Puia sp.]